MGKNKKSVPTNFAIVVKFQMTIENFFFNLLGQCWANFSLWAHKVWTYTSQKFEFSSMAFLGPASKA